MKMSIDDAKKDLDIESTNSNSSLEFDVIANQKEINVKEGEKTLQKGTYSSAYVKDDYVVLKPSNQSTNNVENIDRVWQCFTSSLLEVKKLGKTPHFVYGKDGMSIWRREKNDNDMKKELVPRSNDEYYFSDIARALNIVGGGKSPVSAISMDYQYIKKGDKSMLQLIANLYTRAIILGMDDRKANNFVYKYEPKKENKGGEITLYDIDISRSHYSDYDITPLFSRDLDSWNIRTNYFFTKMPFLFKYLGGSEPELFDQLTNEINKRIRETIPNEDDIYNIVKLTCRKLIRKTGGKQGLSTCEIKEILGAWINYSKAIKRIVKSDKYNYGVQQTPKETHDFDKKILSIYDCIINAMDKTTTVLENCLNNEQKINDILQNETADALDRYNSKKNAIKEEEEEMNKKIHQENEDALKKKRKEINDVINKRLGKQKTLYWEKNGKDKKLMNTIFFLRENAGYIRKINNFYDKMCKQGKQNNPKELQKLLNLAQNAYYRPICVCY